MVDASVTETAVSCNKPLKSGGMKDHQEAVEPPTKKRKVIYAPTNPGLFDLPDYLQPTLHSTPLTSSNAPPVTIAQEAFKRKQADIHADVVSMEQSTKSSGKHGKIDVNNMFLTAKKVILNLTKEIIKQYNDKDQVFKALFSKELGILRVKTAYKEATIEQKQYLIRSIKDELLLKMRAPDFVVTPDIQALIMKTVNLKDDGINFKVLEAQRYVKSIYSDQLRSFDPGVVRAAQRNRSISVVQRGESVFRPYYSKDRPIRPASKPDLGFLKEKKTPGSRP